MGGDDAEDVVLFAPAQTGDQANVIGTLASAFIDDPVERWLWPEAQQYLTQFPAFVAAFGGDAFTRQTVWTLGGFAAVAWWIPPGFEPDAVPPCDHLSRRRQTGPHPTSRLGGSPTPEFRIATQSRQ